MGREVTKTSDTKLRSNTRRHVGQEHTLLYYATQSVVRALTYADQGAGPTLTISSTLSAASESKLVMHLHISPDWSMQLMISFHLFHCSIQACVWLQFRWRGLKCK